MEVAEKKWYVIRVVTGQEVKIKDYIDYELSRVSLDKQIEEMLVTTEKVVQIRKGKNKVNEQEKIKRNKSLMNKYDIKLKKKKNNYLKEIFYKCSSKKGTY